MLAILNIRPSQMFIFSFVFTFICVYPVFKQCDNNYPITAVYKTLLYLTIYRGF